MAKQLFANNASAMLAASIDDADLTIQVANGFGALFPNPGADEFFTVTLEDATGDIEVVRIASRSSDLLTVASGGRGYDGTNAKSWTGGVTRVELRMHKGALDRFIQREGDTMSGDLDMDGNEVKDAELTGSGTKMLAGQIVNVPLRGVVDDASNEIVVPTDGSRATASGSAILTQGDNLFTMNNVFPAGMIMLWYGSLANIPAGWVVCDGTNGTPDMRGRVPVGVSSDHAFNSTGGAEFASGNTTSAGGHTHGGSTGGTTLTVDQIPSHRHFAAAGVLNTNTALTNANQIGSNSDDSVTSGNSEYRLRSAGPTPDANVGRTSATGGGQAHSHSISSDGAHTHALDAISIMQPYRALYYIMKT